MKENCHFYMEAIIQIASFHMHVPTNIIYITSRNTYIEQKFCYVCVHACVLLCLFVSVCIWSSIQLLCVYIICAVVCACNVYVVYTYIREQAHYSYQLYIQLARQLAAVLLAAVDRACMYVHMLNTYCTYVVCGHYVLHDVSYCTLSIRLLIKQTQTTRIAAMCILDMYTPTTYKFLDNYAYSQHSSSMYISQLQAKCVICACSGCKLDYERVFFTKTAAMSLFSFIFRSPTLGHTSTQLVSN